MLSTGQIQNRMTAYLLDTNALCSLGDATLEAARGAGHELLVSPVSLWELISHLEDEPFALPSANARRAGLCQILDDPLAEIMADLGCGAAANPTRFRDRNAVLALLRELETATSYSALCGRAIIVDEEVRSLAGVASNAVSVFEEEQGRYVEAMREQCTAYVDRYGRRGTINLGSEQFCQESLQLARGLREDAQAAGCSLTFTRIADRTALGFGYFVARACAYVGNVGDGQPLVIDPNDLEDYFVCLHLGISSGRVFVTDDRGTRRAVDRTLEAFRSCASEMRRPFLTEARVITTAEFRAEVGRVGPTAQ